MNSVTISDQLFARNIQITLDDLLIWCGDHKDSYVVFRSPQGSTIMLKGSDAICTVLKQAPMHIMNSVTISDQLFARNIQITLDDLLIWCGDHKDSYVVFRSPQGSTIMLKGSDAICTV